MNHLEIHYYSEDSKLGESANIERLYECYHLSSQYNLDQQQMSQIYDI